MQNGLHEILWRQFGASIDMLENAIQYCPEEIWTASMWNDLEMGPMFSEFWYIAYHTLFFLDLYLTGTVEGFHPPYPFTLDELDPAGLLPERVYLHSELLSYLEYCRQKCHLTLLELSEEKAQSLCEFPLGELSFLELQLDNMRHVQEHSAQMNMFLGQQMQKPGRWVARTRE